MCKIRPVIDDKGPRLVDDRGQTVEGVKSWTTRYDANSVLVLTDVVIVAHWPNGPKARADV